MKRASVAVLLLGCFAACGSSPTTLRVTTPDGATLAYLVSNPVEQPAAERRRVILIHGAPADASSWDRFVREQGEALAGFEIITIDRLGYGNSTRGHHLLLAEHARAIEPLLTADTILVGHSYGGPVALRAAAEFPDRVAGLVLVAGACDPSMDDAQWLRKVGIFFGWVVPRSWDTANRELLALTDENRATEGLVERVTARVAVLHGTSDMVCPHDSTIAYLQQALTNAEALRIESLKGKGHNLHVSHTALLAELIRWSGE